MRSIVLLVTVMVALAGCAKKDDTPPATGGKGQGTATAVAIDTPKAPIDGESEVCWTVQGSGHVTHTAVHWDSESHDDDANATFQAYDQGAAYPDDHEGADGKPAADPEGYDLPGEFCATVPVPTTGTRYIVAHVLDKAGAPGRISEEVEIAGSVGVSDYTLVTSGVPTTVEAGQNFTFTLTVAGPPGTSQHVGAHFGPNASATPTTAIYARPCVHDTNATLPGTFTVTCAMPTAGTWHLRGHMIVGPIATGRHYWGATDHTITATAGGNGTAGNGTAITIKTFAYAPNPLTVPPGATVNATNMDPVAHTVTADDGSFDTGNIAPGASATFTAPTAPGDYPYTCKIHPVMKGTLRVA